MSSNAYQADKILLDAILEFVSGLEHPEISRFRQELQNWGSEWQYRQPNYLPAAEQLRPAKHKANRQTRHLVDLFEQQRHRFYWEQSYTRADNLVGDDMLNGYGFVEVVGKYGPFVSEKVRSGIGVWGPNIVYPEHWHPAEEIYLPLAGSATFLLGDQPSRQYHPGEIAYVSSNLHHGFRTNDELMVVFYIWRAGGDMRQKLDFTRLAS